MSTAVSFTVEGATVLVNLAPGTANVLWRPEAVPGE